MKFHINNRKIKNNIDPDEIFLDSKNLPQFNTQQFEGKIEKPIPKYSVYILGIFFLFFFLVFIWKIFSLQIIQGDYYLKKSENNTLIQRPIFAERGIIYDRNEIPLAWNQYMDNDFEKLSSPNRSYISSSGFGLLLGYVSAPALDSSGYYWREDFIGKDGIEKYYNDSLKGENGMRITETDVLGVIQAENIILPTKPGSNMVLSIDSRIQEKMYKYISDMAHQSNFNAGAGVLIDIKNGEILSLISYPEYNSNILSKGDETNIINSYFSDKRKVFLNRAIAGLYSPGSIVKPFLGYSALVENVITPLKTILSNGQISIPNPYYPGKKSVFKDHGSFGYVDMRKAISISSDVYFYEIGGGFENQKGLGIANIDKYSKLFGIGQKTGVDLFGEKDGNIPTPEWKAKTFKNDPWRIGDTYNTSIGQYGFQVTPIQMAKAVSVIANMGVTYIPHILKDDENYKTPAIDIDIDEDKMKVIYEGMRMAVTEGTCMALNIPSVKVAAKSGTAQVGLGNTNTNSWIIGFFPYENPRYAFSLVMERGPKAASGNATYVMSQVIEYMNTYTPEYLR